jgi:hypothetical protein
VDADEYADEALEGKVEKMDLDAQHSLIPCEQEIQSLFALLLPRPSCSSSHIPLQNPTDTRTLDPTRHNFNLQYSSINPLLAFPPPPLTASTIAESNITGSNNYGDKVNHQQTPSSAPQRLPRKMPTSLPKPFTPPTPPKRTKLQTDGTDG